MQMKHNCGLFGVQGSDNASNLAYLGLYALQHRGQESTGIVTSDRRCFHALKCPGLVSDRTQPLFHHRLLTDFEHAASCG